MTEPHHDGARPNGATPAEAGRGAMAALAADPALSAEARRRVEETSDSYRRIADDLALPPGSLHRHASLNGWRRPPDAPAAPARARGAPPGRRPLAATMGDAEAVMGRLVRAVDRQVGRIESRLRKRGADFEEKDARILGTLAKTLATLMALERDGGAKARETEPVDRGAISSRELPAALQLGLRRGQNPLMLLPGMTEARDAEFCSPTG